MRGEGRQVRGWRGPACLLAVAMLGVLAAPPGRAERATPTASPWWQGDLTFGVGFDLSAGGYGEPVDTEMLYLPFTATYLFDDISFTDYAWDQLELRLTIPYIAIDGPAGFIPGVESPTRRDAGIGDILLRGTYVWLPELDSRLPAIEVLTWLKIPTADASKNLGTGHVDVAFEVDVSKRFGRLSPFATGGYRIVGDGENLRLQNHWFGSLGVSARLHAAVSLGVAYEWAQASRELRRNSQEIVPYASLRLPGRVTLGPYLSFGLSGYVPDYGGGMSIRYTIPIRPHPAP